jgi:poly(3-hydroxybutyrate) depolymerase
MPSLTVRPPRLAPLAPAALLALLLVASGACTAPAGNDRGGATGGSTSETGGSGGGQTPRPTGGAGGGSQGGGASGSGSGGTSGTSGGGGSASGGSGGAARADAAAASPDADPIDDPDPTPGDGGVTGGGDGGPPAPPASPKTTTPSEACTMAKGPPADGYHTIMAADKQRRFILRLPPTYDGKKPWPVIFAFHGAGDQDATTFDTKFGFKAENGSKAVLVFGEALPRPQGGRSWMIDTAANMAFMDAVVAWLKSNVCIDVSRLFATGQSSGGYFSQTLGCQRGHVFRAVAPSSGGWRDFVNCMGNPGVWMSHGKTDTGTAADVAKAKAFWLERKMCSPINPTPTDPSPCVAYSGCLDKVPFVFCEHPGGHPWPSYATKGVWTFFSQF